MVEVIMSIGAGIVTIVLTVLGFFLMRYVRSQDTKNERFFAAIDRLEETSNLIKLMIEKQNYSCINKMDRVESHVLTHEKRVTKLEKVTETHSKQIGGHNVLLKKLKSKTA